MALSAYGVLKGSVIDKKVGAGSNPHYQIRIVDTTDDWRVAVNVKSQASPSEVLYTVCEHFQHPVCDILEKLRPGFTPKSQNLELGLDYIRDNLFSINSMKPLPFNVPGPDNDLNELVDTYVSRVQANENAFIYAFGEHWPETNEKDKYFGFKPQKGIHDIHMNQGNSGAWKKDNGTHQDGALLFHLKDRNQWVALFLAFQSQSFHTNDQTGDPLPVVPTDDIRDVVVIGALIDPPGKDLGKQRIFLFNQSSKDVDLKGWSIVDSAKRKTSFESIKIKAMSLADIPLDGKGCQFAQKGDIISLWDSTGVRRMNVSYTKAEVLPQKVVLFRR